MCFLDPTNECRYPDSPLVCCVLIISSNAGTDLSLFASIFRLFYQHQSQHSEPNQPSHKSGLVTALIGAFP